jgi:glyoxylase-like metal-dependent hydrolase (beta-lactamase superfamily II)
MTGSGTENGLSYDVLISATVPLKAPPLPNGDARTWAPLSTTLISSATDAILIDPPLTSEQATRVGDWIKASGKRLTHIIITHGHGDHWFTATAIADRFPGAQVAATPGTIKQMRKTEESRGAFWDQILPGQIPSSPVTAQPARGNQVLLEGHIVEILDVGHSDTDDTSIVHVPDLRLVIAGDVVYDGVHQFLVESDHGGRDAWRRALDVVEALDPRHIVAGHARSGNDHDASRLITPTRRYLDDADELLAGQPTAAEFVAGMLLRHPDDLNPSTLFGSAAALFAPV